MLNLGLYDDKSSVTLLPSMPPPAAAMRAPATAGARPLGNNVKSQAVFENWDNDPAGQGDGSAGPALLVGPSQDSLLLRYKLLAQSKRLLAGLVREGHNLLGCQTVPFAAGWVEILRAIDEGERGRAVAFRNIKNCHSVWCCPVCSARIAAGRTAELRQGIYSAKRAGLDAYMLTLTFRHGRQDDLAELLTRMSAAMAGFWGHWGVKNLWRDWGGVGHIRATELTFSNRAGWHPHMHILLIGPSGLHTDRLETAWAGYWVEALRRAGLQGVEGVACQLQGAAAVQGYLTKMPAELALGNVTKQSRTEGGFSPFQLLGMSHYGEPYKTLWRAYYEATKGRRALVWSRGLKTRLGVADVSDDQIADITGASEVLLLVHTDDWRKLAHEDIAWIRRAGAWSLVEIIDTLDARGVRYRLGENRPIAKGA